MKEKLSFSQLLSLSLMLFALFFGVLSTPLGYVNTWFIRGVDWLASLPFKLAGLL